MDGYSNAAMMERCRDDYEWDVSTTHHNNDEVAKERVDMMSHLYNNTQLWRYVSMVAFSNHYLMDGEGYNNNKAYETFQRQKEQQHKLNLPPIFGGVVWDDWLTEEDDQSTLARYQEKGIDYVRIHCNFGDDIMIGGSDNDQLLTPRNNALFGKLAKATKKCQVNELVPLLLLQLPWREPDADDYFQWAMKSIASELQMAGVDCGKVFLETRPPIGISAQKEERMCSILRQEVGLKTGQTMFDAIKTAFQGDTTSNSNNIAGFCVAGGSTKGEFPTAMQDDTQNAVRQGIRLMANEEWGYDLCFWEMGAKLMLQPKIGRLWGHNGQAGRDAARELFCVNARDMGDEIKAGL